MTTKVRGARGRGAVPVPAKSIADSFLGPPLQLPFQPSRAGASRANTVEWPVAGDPSDGRRGSSAQVSIFDASLWRGLAPRWPEEGPSEQAPFVFARSPSTHEWCYTYGVTFCRLLVAYHTVDKSNIPPRQSHESQRARSETSTEGGYFELLTVPSTRGRLSRLF